MLSSPPNFILYTTFSPELESVIVSKNPISSIGPIAFVWRLYFASLGPIIVKA